MMEGNVYLAFTLTLLAGLSTGIGSAIAFFAKRTNKVFLSVSLGFSAGVMIYVSFVEIFPKARNALSTGYGAVRAYWITTAAFFAGIAVIALIDYFVPEHENPHEARSLEEMNALPNAINEKKLMRMGLFAALAIGIHNFPEGMATFIAALSSKKLGMSIALAIAIHNIPEGISVSVPIFFATGSRRQAFFYSFLSGLSEPVGALAGYFILKPFLSPALFGILFASVAGIMVFISLDELLPTAREYSKGHWTIFGVISGMAVMAISLLLFV